MFQYVRRTGLGLCVTMFASVHTSIHCSEMTAKIPQDVTTSQRILYSNRPDFDRKLSIMRKAGPQKLQVITDFDFTLSKFWVNGQRGCSCHKVIEDCGLLLPSYHKAAQALQHYYYAIEVDPTMPGDKKLAYMIEWVEKGHALMLQSGCTRQTIVDAVTDANIRIRDGVQELFARTEQFSVPVLIFSAGIADVLEEVLRKYSHLPKNAVVLSNRMIFSADNRLIGFQEPVFHVFNKHASTAPNAPYFKSKQSRQRCNVVLIGDSPADPDMLVGMHPETVIKIGFLNDKIERLDTYLKLYDVVLLGDGDMSFANSVIETICAAADQ